MNKKRLIALLAEIKIRIDTGNGHLVWVRNIVIIAAGLTYLFNLSRFQTILLFPVIAILLYSIGAIDLDLLKLTQKIQALLTGKYNYHLKDVAKK